MAKTAGGIRGNLNTSSATARRREGYIKEMQPLLKKNVIRYVGNDKHIKIKFNRKGISHIANDMIEKNLGLSKKELPKLDDFLRDAIYINSSKKYKGRSDRYDNFYYFKDKNKKIYYHVAEETNISKNGKVKFNRYLHAITKTEP